MGPKLVRDSVPPSLEGKLEAARLDLLALFRGLDQLDMSANELPQVLLHELFDLDGDYAVALAALDSPRREVNVAALLRETRRSLSRLGGALTEFLRELLAGRCRRLQEEVLRVRAELTREDAYHSIPGMEPRAERSSSTGRAKRRS